LFKPFSVISLSRVKNNNLFSEQKQILFYGQGIFFKAKIIEKAGIYYLMARAVFSTKLFGIILYINITLLFSTKRLSDNATC